MIAGISAYVSSCNSSSTSTSYENTSTYYSTATDMTLQVFYESGAEPFTGTFPSGALAGSSVWSITLQNLQALFQGRSPSVTFHVPTTQSEMTAISAQGKTSWTTNDIKTLGDSQRTRSTATHSYFSILFLNGYYNDGTSNQTSTIGVSISDTPIIAIFKDVVESTGHNPAGPIPRFVEQATLVHEMGHALGLVNNGVTMTTSHQDSSHGAHCSNSNCTMYYLNEGKSDLIAFAVQVNTTGNVVMFGSECLNDTRSYKP